MIQFTEHKNIDKKKWDNCIDSSSNNCIFVYSWYLDIVFEDWSALILNDYEAVFPMASKSKYKINYLSQPYFTRYFGVYKKGNVTERIVGEFFDAIPEKFKYIEFCLHESNAINRKDIKLKERKFQLLDISSDYISIKKGYSENANRSIKKGIKNNLRIELYINPEETVNLFKKTKGQELEVFTPSDYKTLIQLMNVCLKRNNGVSIGVYDGETLCSAAFFMVNKNRFIYLKSGLTEEGKTKGAMYFLMDYFIQQQAGKNSILDFGGSSVENVAGFYKKFGAKDCVYLQVKKNKLPGIVNWIKKLKL